jgi:hypothetical protein
MAEFLDAARKHLEAEEVEEALDKADAAKRSFTAGGDADGLADVVRLTVHAQNHLGKIQESALLAQKELSNARSKGQKGAEARLLLAMAETAARGKGVFKTADALQFAEEARAVFKEQKMPKLEGEALLALVNIFLKGAGAVGKANFQTALEKAKDALDLFQAAKDKKGQAMAMHAIAAARMNTQNVEGGLRTAKDALRIFAELGNKRNHVFELQCVAAWHIQAGLADRALPYAEEAYRLVREGDFGGSWEANALNTLVQALCGNQEGSKAAKLAGEAAATYRKAGNKQGEATALDAQVSAHLSLDDTAQALKAAEATVVLLRSLGNAQEEALMLRLISRFHVEMQNYPEAVKAAKSSMKLLRASDALGKSGRASSLNAMAEVMVESQQIDEAMKVVAEERAFYQKAKDQRGEALTLLIVVGLYIDSSSYDEAVKTAEIAQGLFRGMDDKAGEATALQMIAQVRMAGNQYELAMQAANLAQPLLKDTGDKRGEVGMLLIRAQAASLLLVGSGGDPFSKTFKEASKLAVVDAQTAVALTRKIGDPALVGSGLCMLAQAEMVHAQGLDAEAAASEAVEVFRDLADKTGEAYALVMYANALIVSGKPDRGREEAQKGLAVFQELGDAQGVLLAENAIDTLEGAARKGGVRSGARSAAGGAGGGIVETTIDQGQLRHKVRTVVSDIVGMDDIGDDQPLMNIGLTSQSAVLLRNALTKDFPGPSLPFTMMFDYPSINDLTEFFVVRAGD